MGPARFGRQCERWPPRSPVLRTELERHDKEQDVENPGGQDEQNLGFPIAPHVAMAVAMNNEAPNKIHKCRDFDDVEAPGGWRPVKNGEDCEEQSDAGYGNEWTHQQQDRSYVRGGRADLQTQRAATLGADGSRQITNVVSADGAGTVPPCNEVEQQAAIARARGLVRTRHAEEHSAERNLPLVELALAETPATNWVFSERAAHRWRY